MILRKAIVLSVCAVTLSIGLPASAASINASENAQSHIPACPGAQHEESALCHARVISTKGGTPAAATTPAGLSPAQLRAAYGLSGIAPVPGTIIAIVDAYDHPNIASDLATYSKQFGLPQLPPCGSSLTATPCFKKIDQRGGTKYPRTDAGWALEIALDVETAHAICQNCTILLVEADNNSYANLMAAVDQAVAQGAKIVSNSYGSAEFSSQGNYDFHFNRPGVAFTVSSGDYGYGAQYPAASPFVTAVGGTTLLLNADNTVKTETAWSGAGSGCSAYSAKPAHQSDTGCAKRMIADVAAVADPNTGAAVYTSVRFQGQKGWFKVGGTSLAAPVIAGVYALAGTIPAGTMANSLPYLNAAALRDITSGTNGSCGTNTYFCTAGLGYDGPTGLGTPNGAGAF